LYHISHDSYGDSFGHGHRSVGATPDDRQKTEDLHERGEIILLEGECLLNDGSLPLREDDASDEIGLQKSAEIATEGGDSLPSLRQRSEETVHQRNHYFHVVGVEGGDDASILARHHQNLVVVRVRSLEDNLEQVGDAREGRSMHVEERGTVYLCHGDGPVGSGWLLALHDHVEDSLGIATAQLCGEVDHLREGEVGTADDESYAYTQHLTTFRRRQLLDGKLTTGREGAATVRGEHD
ncbi:hypothetical protein PMAYCL1PPCAC_06309, partial [Pristionchus mayeri]